MPRPRLNKEQVREAKQQLGIWLGLPKEVRQPKTLDELAKQLSTSSQALCGWQKDQIVKDAKTGAIKLLGGNNMYEVTRTIIQKAKEGNFQMARLYMEWQEQLGAKGGGKAEPLELIIKHGTKERDTD